MELAANLLMERRLLEDIDSQISVRSSAEFEIFAALKWE
jgi:hypothetical protein